MTDEQKEKSRIQSAQWYKANSKKTLERLKVWRKENPEQFAICAIKNKYKVDLETATSLYLRSMQNCECCGLAWCIDMPKRLIVDHNHNTGVVRGILCHQCNVTLGLLKEDSDRITKLLEYNRKHNG